MSDDNIADDAESTGDINRRRFVQGLAVAGGVAAFGSMGASASSTSFNTKAVSQAEAERLFATEAADVIETLASEGVLSEASLNELPTQQTTTDPRQPGVTREVSNDDEIYVVRQQTDDGTLAVLVRASDGNAIGVHSTSEGNTFYDEDGTTPAAQACSGCQDTDACPTPRGVPDEQGLYCFGTFITCCG